MATVAAVTRPGPQRPQPGGQRRRAVVVEPHPVDQRPLGREAEHPRLRVARLRPRGHRADLDEPEPEGGQPDDALAVLVEPGRQPERAGEVQPERPHPQRRVARRQHPPQRQGQTGHRGGRPDQPEPGPVGRLGRQPSQQNSVNRPVHRRPPSSLAPRQARPATIKPWPGTTVLARPTGPGPRPPTRPAARPPGGQTRANAPDPSRRAKGRPQPAGRATANQATAFSAILDSRYMGKKAACRPTKSNRAYPKPSASSTSCGWPFTAVSSRPGSGWWRASSPRSTRPPAAPSARPSPCCRTSSWSPASATAAPGCGR